MDNDNNIIGNRTQNPDPRYTMPITAANLELTKKTNPTASVRNLS